MKKKKIKLKDLKVKSQITTLNTDEADEVVGGLGFRPNGNNPVVPDLGKKLMWTVTEQRGELVVHRKYNDLKP